MRIFDNQVQKVKNEILTQVASAAFKGELGNRLFQIPMEVNPGPEPRFRCCVHHERAVSMERIVMVTGGNEAHPHLVEVLESACDQCPVERYVITEACRGCLAHRCQQSCPRGAISFVEHHAVIDYQKCVECGRCKEACPYNAIADVKRPCMKKCPTGAIEIDERKKAVINQEACIACGQCVYQCPFGAIQERSEIVPVIERLRQPDQVLYAVVAPAFATQFDYVEREQVIAAIRQLGFRDVVEAALGADLVVTHEMEELLERKAAGEVMTSSCCPAFVNFIEQRHPGMIPRISQTASPMTIAARLIKATSPEAEVVFIGPCIAKKTEMLRQPGVDFVLTFEELAALIEARGIDLESLEGVPLDNASSHGRRFAASGGVARAITHALESRGIQGVVLKQGDGLSECDRLLKLAGAGRLGADFIEGMACEGGCIKGPVTMHHGNRDVRSLEKYAASALEEDFEASGKVLEGLEIQLTR